MIWSESRCIYRPEKLRCDGGAEPSVCVALRFSLWYPDFRLVCQDGVEGFPDSCRKEDRRVRTSLPDSVRLAERHEVLS